MAISYAVGQRQYDTRSGRIIPNVLPMIMQVDPDLNEAGFLFFMSKLGVETTKQEKFTWDVDDWAARSDTTAAAVTAAATWADVTTVARWIPGEIWLNKRTGEFVWVKSVSRGEGRVELVRGLTAQNSSGGTAAAAMNSGDTLIRINPLVGEDNRRQTTRTTVPEEIYNYTMAMRKDIAMSRRQIKREFVNDNEWSYQEKKAMQEFRMEINAALLVNQRARYTDPTMGDVTVSGGIRSAITTYSATASGTLYEYDFDQALMNKGFRRGSRKKLGVFSTAMILAISEMTKDRVVYDIPLTSKEGSAGITVMVYKAPNGGELMIAEDRFLSDNLNGEGFIVDPTQLKRKVFSNNGINDDLHMQLNTQDDDDPGRDATFYGDIGLFYGVESHHMKWSGVSGGAKGRSIA